MDVYLKIFCGSAILMGLRYVLVAGGAFLIFWILLWKKLKKYRIQANRPSSKDIRREFLYSCSTVLIFGLVGMAVHFLAKNGYSQFYWKVHERGWPYLFLSVVLIILLHDTYFYWAHRLMHVPGIYGKIHKVHHLSLNPSPLAAYAFDPLEAVAQGGILPLAVVLIPCHPLALALFLGYMITLNVWGHLGFEFFPKGFTTSRWTFWHNTSTHHNIHHFRPNHNFGIYFNLWDRWMGTNHPDYHKDFERVKRGKKLPA